MKRRDLLRGSGALAALASVGLVGCSRGSEPPAAFWSQSWESPGGQPLAAADFRGRPLLLNFWATWCPPCVEELPLLDQFFQSHLAQGWQVLGLAIDQPSAVRAFLARRPLAFPIGLAGLGGTELSRELGNSNGGLPFSVLFDPAGRLVERKLGRLLSADLERWQSL
ncbi:TlpA disulfide reductase family protein [Malikia spinosa]|uniref:TlpA family protein disulfide reductase n=1 Tax=Malikia spinosa TaxID=86180 RepID=A0A7C9MUG6_9BURK|nr:TlpA disulfide reductase family protein [Malikia spinosa]MYZ51857.1 TlpA family protein disulfide reductase [Malikia spinosa]OGB70659.1 MAG: redoxin [Burkholderiales bacterium RIFOXYC12_FULL_65_23]